MKPICIRLATVGDAESINEIINHYIAHSTHTFRTELWTFEERSVWMETRSESYPAVVAEIDGRIVGWGALSPNEGLQSDPRAAETSIYVHPEFLRRGVGSSILRDLISRAAAAGHRALLAGCCSESASSIALHERHGFVRVGHLANVARKFDRPLDLICLAKVL